MAKFINKKEQVFDLQLTTYGRKMLSVSSFKPTYYAFFDDNVVYDGDYIGLNDEKQNEINTRIKDDTQYIETLTLFEDLEKTVLQNRGNAVNYFSLNNMQDKFEPAEDMYRYDAIIGDANLDGDTQSAPAWKVVALQSEITASSTRDNINDTNIPQVDITANYILRTRDAVVIVNPEQVADVIQSTAVFGDNKQIVLEATDPLVYAEEVNTLLLNDNFEIEIFEVPTEQSSRVNRKYFKKTIPQIKDGLMLTAKKQMTPVQDLTTASVEYYFDVLTDHQVDQAMACKGAEIFNKQSYYIDLDFDCETEEENVFFDIYGVVTEPEICQS